MIEVYKQFKMIKQGGVDQGLQQVVGQCYVFDVGDSVYQVEMVELWLVVSGQCGIVDSLQWGVKFVWCLQ